MAKITRAKVARYNNYLKVVMKPVKFTGAPLSGCYPGIIVSKATTSTFGETTAPIYNIQYISPLNIGGSSSDDRDKIITDIIDAEWWNPHFVGEIPKNTTCHIFIMVNSRTGKQKFYFTIDQFTSVPL